AVPGLSSCPLSTGCHPEVPYASSEAAPTHGVRVRAALRDRFPSYESLSSLWPLFIPPSRLDDVSREDIVTSRPLFFHIHTDLWLRVAVAMIDFWKRTFSFLLQHFHLHGDFFACRCVCIFIRVEACQLVDFPFTRSIQQQIQLFVKFAVSADAAHF